MNRREFAKTIAGGVVAAGLTRRVAGDAAGISVPAPQPSAPRVNNLHHVGGDYHSILGKSVTGKNNLEYNQRFGVKHLTASIGFGKSGGLGGEWKMDRLQKMRDDCDKGGMIWEGIRMDSDYIMLRPGDERDRKLDIIIGNIQKASKVGVQFISYHWTMIPIDRNGVGTVRGNAKAPSFKLEENWKDLPVGPAGKVSSDEYWERIETFLRKAIPVCEEYKVKMAVHPYDPPGLPFGYKGVENWDSPDVFAALKRYVSLVDSPYNTVQLCLGTIAEGLTGPKTEILPIVRYFGETGKIAQVHMRNIRGHRYDFVETFVDDGEMDFLEVIRILRDAGYAGSYCPDHNPEHPDDPGKLQAYAFAYGYIKALIHAANREVAA